MIITANKGNAAANRKKSATFVSLLRRLLAFVGSNRSKCLNIKAERREKCLV